MGIYSVLVPSPSSLRVCMYMCEGRGQGVLHTPAYLHIYISIYTLLVTNWIICLHRPEGNLGGEKAQLECTSFKFSDQRGCPETRCHGSPHTLSEAS